MEDAKCAAGIVGVGKPEKSGGGERFTKLQLVPHQEFAELVDDENQGGQLNQDKVLVDGDAKDNGAHVWVSGSAWVLSFIADIAELLQLLGKEPVDFRH